MDKALADKLPLAAKSVWRIYSMIQILIETIIFGVVVYITRDISIPNYAIIIVGILLLIYFIVIGVIVPNIRWSILSYEVREHEVELQTGLFIVKRTIIPIIRVQHVDVKQGPLTKRKYLANIEITTAATTHTIPLLNEQEADRLRLKISELARVAKEDV